MSLVSVILPSCNSQAWVAETIQSVLNQSHDNLELIVIDDGSSDDSLNIVEGFAADPRLSIIKRSSCSGGPASPRNDGIKTSSGEYLAFVDSDDIWHPRKLELQLRAMRQHGLNFSSSLHTSFRDRAPKVHTINDASITIQRKNHQQLLNKNWVVTSSALASKHLFDGIAFDHSDEYVGIEDYLMWLNIHQRDDIQSAIVEAPLVHYRLRPDSISASKRAMANKIFYLLGHYKVNGKPLGLKKYYFFATYALTSIISRATKR